MSNAILYRMPYGIPGDLTRRQNDVIVSQNKDSGSPFPAYGVPVKMSAGRAVPIAAAGDIVYGWLVRDFPTQGANANDPIGTAVPAATDGACSIMRRGFMSVHVNAGVAAFGGQVYVRVSNAGVGKPIGGVEAGGTFGTAVGAAGGANTGNGTITAAPVVGADAQAGVTRITMLTATTFRVETPDGLQHANGATGVAYTGGTGLTFTVTVGGTPMVAGDYFTITTTAELQAVPGCTFQSAADAGGFVEISQSMGL